MSPARSATESLSTPVMKTPKLYSRPPRIIRPRDCPGSILRSTFRSLHLGGHLGETNIGGAALAYSNGGDTGLPCRSIHEYVCLTNHGPPTVVAAVMGVGGGSGNTCCGKLGLRTVMLNFRHDFSICEIRWRQQENKNHSLFWNF